MTDPIAEQAAQWLLELENPEPHALREFAAWLQSSPRHIEEFLLATAVWEAFDQFDPARQLDIRQLVEAARNNVSALPAPPSKGDAEIHLPHRWRMTRALVAVAAVLVISMASWIFREASHEFSTALGEQRAFKLADGSVLYLNTQSRVEVTFSREARIVRLLEGEAMFAVEHDAARPFRVLSGTTVIQAIGTRFNVYRTPAGTTVSVVEGVVQISPEPVPSADLRPAPSADSDARVSAGEQARVSPAGEVMTRAVPGLAQLVAWRERRLVFRDDPLDSVATEFNRYNSLQLRVDGDAAKNKHITGVFSADDPRSFVLFLERDADLSITPQGNEILIRQR